MRIQTLKFPPFVFIFSLLFIAISLLALSMAVAPEQGIKNTNANPSQAAFDPSMFRGIKRSYPWTRS